MNNEMFTDLAIKITSELSALNANMKNVLDKLADHEKRLDDLEKKKESKESREDSWKNQLLLLLAKAAVIGGVAIASLVGAGGILSKIIGG